MNVDLFNNSLRMSRNNHKYPLSDTGPAQMVGRIDLKVFWVAALKIDSSVAFTAFDLRDLCHSVILYLLLYRAHIPSQHSEFWDNQHWVSIRFYFTFLSNFVIPLQFHGSPPYIRRISELYCGLQSSLPMTFICFDLTIKKRFF